MSIESVVDWQGLRRVGRLVDLTLRTLQANVRAGISTGELDEIAARFIAQHGGRSAPAMVYGFPGTVLISVNDEIVHGIPGDRRLESGDVVKLDVTLEKAGYIADAARTVVVQVVLARPNDSSPASKRHSMRRSASRALAIG